MNLYELTGQLLELQSMMEDESIDPETLADTIEGVQGEFDLKIKSYCYVRANLLATVDALKVEAERLTNRRKVIEKNVERLENYMFDSMKAVQCDKVESDLFTVTIRKNGGKRPLVIDSEDIPDEFILLKKELNKTAIREYLEAGNTCTYAHLEERGESLKIK